ncbi:MULTISPECIES: DUF1236 domain-containing protein [Rhizobium/Agrobacterium group]|uniref:SH3b domain-containing protein n=1 Tax=Pararhizobium antarcticum TaxID=1798805 RepID=A0A657LSD6_9HYPH|nr:hypothetical protein AX760_02700 [Pararhizobium antarcticum]OJF99020.1 hypothetical protein AX761_12145 [Rhizobium sp. 58]
MKLRHMIALSGFALAATTSLAFAQMSVTTVTDLNIQSGPGTEYPTVGLATRGSAGVLDGCIEGSNWCRIDVNGMRGWVFAENLSVDQGGQPMIVEQHRVDLGVPVVTYETTSSAVAAPDPQPGDELLGRVGEVNPPELVRTYIDTNPVETVTIDGDIIVGGTVPETVTMVEVPDYQYRYARVNDRQVLVDPATRQIVYVYQ